MRRHPARAGEGADAHIRHGDRSLPPRLQPDASHAAASTKPTTASGAVQPRVALSASTPARISASVVRASGTVCADHHPRGGGNRYQPDPDRRGARALSLRPSPYRRTRPGHAMLLDAVTLSATPSANATEHARSYPDRAAARKAAARRHERRGPNAAPHGRGGVHPAAHRSKPGGERTVGSPERRELPAARRPQGDPPQAQRHDYHVRPSSLRAPGGHGHTLAGAEHQDVGAERGKWRPARPHCRAMLHLVHGPQERDRRAALLQRHHVPHAGARQRVQPTNSLLLPPQEHGRLPTHGLCCLHFLSPRHLWLSHSQLARQPRLRPARARPRRHAHPRLCRGQVILSPGEGLATAPPPAVFTGGFLDGWLRARARRVLVLGGETHSPPRSPAHALVWPRRKTVLLSR